jgi:hypothetical protein
MPENGTDDVVVVLLNEEGRETEDAAIPIDAGPERCTPGGRT